MPYNQLLNLKTMGIFSSRHTASVGHVPAKEARIIPGGFSGDVHEEQRLKELAELKAAEARKAVERAEALAEKKRVHDRATSVLTQLPRTKAFKKVTLDDAFTAVHCVDEASRVILEYDDYMKEVDELFDGLVKALKHKEHVVRKMISVQGLNLETGEIFGSEGALRAELKKDEARIRERVLDQLPKTGAFKKVTLKDASMAVRCVDEASRVIDTGDHDYMKDVDDLFKQLYMKLKHKDYVVKKMISVQGLNLKTGEILGSEEALRADILAKKKKCAMEAQERRSKWTKCVSCHVQPAFLKAKPPKRPWDVTHCCGCADPDVHIYPYEYPEGETNRVRLENVKPFKHASASLV